MHTKCVATGLLALASTSAFALTAPPFTQAVTPDSYPTLPLVMRQGYVAGVMDVDRSVLDYTKGMFSACLKGVTLAQATEIVDRGIAQLGPVERNTAPTMVHNALLYDCLRRGFKVE